jgi:hypothetical protein
MALTRRFNRGCARRFSIRAALGLVLILSFDVLHFGSTQAQANGTEPVRQVVLVGPSRSVKTLAEASRVARDGALVEVDSGEYAGDVAVWTQNRITLRAIGGRVKLRAAGQSAEGKAIWVIRAIGVSVEGFDFEDAAVPDRNGAGIRLETGSLHLRDCKFVRNEMGLLTSNDPTAVLLIENSEFAYNGRPDDHNHNLYVGRIAKLSVTGSYFHHAQIGHLLKSRAALNEIFYNRLTDEAGGTASYELEFPDGGIAYVVGNLIAQGSRTGNRKLISFGAEGYKWPKNEIYLVNNTLVNPLSWGGIFLHVAPRADAVRAVNNLLVGNGTLESEAPGEYRNNFKATARDIGQPMAYDYRLVANSNLVGRATEPGDANGQLLRAVREYVHPRNTRPLVGDVLNPGALQGLAPPQSP